jgi:hypothetical protein
VACHPTDPALVDPRIGKALARRHPGPLPEAEARLARLAADLAPTVFAGALDQPEWRAAVEERLRELFERPARRVEPGGAVVADLGLCPGTLVSRGRLGWHVAASPFAVEGSLRSDVVGGWLEALRRESPAAPAWQVQALVPRPGGGEPRAHQYRYDPRWDRLAVRRAEDPGVVYVSPTLLGGDLSALTDGRSPTHPLELLRSRTTDGVLTDLEGWR